MSARPRSTACRPARVLVTGSIAFDLLLSYDGSFTEALDPKALDRLSVGFVTPRMRRHFGGTAANIAWNLALLGDAPVLVSTIGEDGVPYLERLSATGMDTAHVDAVPGVLTATAIVGTDTAERQITFFHPGADARGSWPALRPEGIGWGIISPRDASLMEQGIAWCSKHRIPALFDPGQQMMAFGTDDLLRLLRASAGVVVNAYERDVLLQRVHRSEEGILEDVPLLITTRGDEGVDVRSRGGYFSVPACRALFVVNPTGAGDALRAGLLYGLARNWDVRDGIRLGCALASFVVEREETQIDGIGFQDIRRRAEATYGEDLPE